jgi:6-oxocamphor hydrolase
MESAAASGGNRPRATLTEMVRNLKNSDDSLDSYERYQHVRIAREGGVTRLQLHTNDGPLVWSGPAHEELGRCFWEIGRDRENKVVVLTGTGDSFIASTDSSGFAHVARGMSPERWDLILDEGQQLIANLLSIPVPVITAVNGPALVHAELAVLGDVNLATPETVFQDNHYRYGLVPGDGAHVIWPELLGQNRGKHFLLTSAKIRSKEALRLGLVSEIVEAQKLLDRALEIAGDIAAQSELVRRYTRSLVTRRLRQQLDAELSHGLALEGVSHPAWRSGR